MGQKFASREAVVLFQQEVKEVSSQTVKKLQDVRLLIVDDNEELLEVLEHILTAQGYQVYTANRAQKAFSILSQVTPDLIICDIMLPDQNGLEFHEELTQSPEWYQIPFVFLTGLTGDEQVRLGKEKGCDEYLTKPFDPDDLVAVVRGKLALSAHRKKMSTSQFEGYRRRIIHTLSHEFRTPLVSINTGAELLLEQREELPQEQVTRLLQSIWRGGQRLERLVNDFMLLQQIDLGHARQTYELYRQKISLMYLVETALECFHETNSANLAPELIVEDRESVEQTFITIYDVQVINVIQRLLSNAYKFGGQDGPVTISALRQGERALIKVRDRGPGMEGLGKLTEKVCEPFTQLNRELYEQQGCGIGLTISRHFTEINGGALSFHQPGDGAGLEALISFPLAT